jgi:hypothetical protein
MLNANVKETAGAGQEIMAILRGWLAWTTIGQVIIRRRALPFSIQTLEIG